MEKISDNSAVQIAQTIRPLTEIAERELLAELAAQVRPGGLIVETGTLYGGTTAVLALANPQAHVTTIDNYQWHPADGGESSPEIVRANLDKLKIENVTIVAEDSRVVGEGWLDPIDLLWIDGGHSYQAAYSDLALLGSWAEKIAIHDFDNPGLPQIRQAVEDFLALGDGWQVERVVGWIAVLSKPE